MANKHNLISWTCSGLASAASTHIGGTVPVGKTRFITYLRVTRNEMIQETDGSLTGCRIDFASVATAGAALSVLAIAAGRKLTGFLPHVSGVASESLIIGKALYTYELPTKPNIDHPIFSVVGSAFAAAFVYSGNAAGVESGATVDIFATYYDE